MKNPAKIQPADMPAELKEVAGYGIIGKMEEDGI